MNDRPKQPIEFDNYAVEYAELIRDPLRERFAASNRFFFERKLDVIQSFFRAQGISTRDLAWLDVGCGQGDMLKVAAPHFKSAAGCDPSEGMLRACSGFDVKLQTSADTLPFENASFDFITAVCVYHHIPEGRRIPLTLEIKRLLKPGGVMCIIEHNPLNPATRLIVSRTPVDADARLLRMKEAKDLVRAAGTVVAGFAYFLLLPQSLHRPMAALERGLSFLPLGGQYAVFGQK